MSQLADISSPGPEANGRAGHGVLGRYLPLGCIRGLGHLTHGHPVAREQGAR